MTDKEIMELVVKALDTFDRAREARGKPALFRHEERVMIDRQLRLVETATQFALGDRRLP